jgi:hypothetical protein
MEIVVFTWDFLRWKIDGHGYHLLLLLLFLLIRDVAELGEVSIRKPDEILPYSVLLACK